MNVESVKTLFTLFSGEDVTEKYAPLINLAMTEVNRMLIPYADKSDTRLEFLCASIANYRLQQIISAREKTAFTIAGKMHDTGKNSSLLYAEKLLNDYINLCSDLVVQRNFVFIGFSGDVGECL